MKSKHWVSFDLGLLSELLSTGTDENLCDVQFLRLCLSVEKQDFLFDLHTEYCVVMHISS